MNLTACLNRSAEADWPAFEARYRRRIRRTVVSTLRSLGAPPRADEVDDLVQEVYCRLLAAGRRSRIRARNEAQGWRYVSCTIRNTVLDHQRNRRAAKRFGRNAWRVVLAFDEIADREPSPEARILAAEELTGFDDLVACGLRGAAREDRLLALRRVLIEGWTSKEVAAASGGVLAPAQIDTWVHRLRRSLARHGIEIPRRRATRARRALAVGKSRR